MDYTYTETKVTKRQRSLDEPSSSHNSVLSYGQIMIPTIDANNKKHISPNSSTISTNKKMRKQSSMVNSKYTLLNSKIIESYHDQEFVKNIRKIFSSNEFVRFIDGFLSNINISESRLFKDNTPNFFNLLFGKHHFSNRIKELILDRNRKEINFIKTKKTYYEPVVFYEKDRKKLFIKSIEILVDVIKDCQIDINCSRIPTDYNKLFQLHLFIILKSYECFKNNDIRNLVILSYVMSQFDEQSHAVMYTIDYKYLKFIQYFLTSSELGDKFVNFIPDDMLISNTLVKDIVNIFVDKIVTDNKSKYDTHILFNFTNSINKFEIKVPKGWEEVSGSREEIDNNNNKIKITDNDHDNIGLYDYQKTHSKIANQTIDLIFQEINDHVMRGGRKKHIQKKNTDSAKIITGPRGGKYKILSSGKKIYMSKMLHKNTRISS